MTKSSDLSRDVVLCLNICQIIKENILKKPAVLKKKRKKMTYEESRHQEAFFEWLELQYPKLFELCFHIPNEGKRSYALANVMKKKGLKAGVPDVFCAIPSGDYHGLFIEFKKEGEEVKTTQYFRMKNFLRVGYACSVCYCFEAAKKDFIEYISIGLNMAKGLQEIEQKAYK